MPNLPTVTVDTQAQADAVLAAFADTDDYAAYVLAAVRDEVLRRTARGLAETANATIATGLAAVEAELPPAPAPEPVINDAG